MKTLETILAEFDEIMGDKHNFICEGKNCICRATTKSFISKTYKQGFEAGMKESVNENRDTLWKQAYEEGKKEGISEEQSRWMKQTANQHDEKIREHLIKEIVNTLPIIDDEENDNEIRSIDIRGQKYYQEQILKLLSVLSKK